MPRSRAFRGRHRPELRRIARRLGSPLRGVVGRRVAVVAARIDDAAAAHEEGAATRTATAALSGSIDEHMEGVMEAVTHLGARVEQAMQALDRIEARLAQHDCQPLNPGRPGGE